MALPVYFTRVFVGFNGYVKEKEAEESEESEDSEDIILIYKSPLF